MMPAPNYFWLVLRFRVLAGESAAFFKRPLGASVFFGVFFLVFASAFGVLPSVVLFLARLGAPPSTVFLALVNRSRLGCVNAALGKAAIGVCTFAVTSLLGAGVRRRRATFVIFTGSSGARKCGGGGATAGGAGFRFHGAMAREGSLGETSPVDSAPPSAATLKI